MSDDAASVWLVPDDGAGSKVRLQRAPLCIGSHSGKVDILLKDRSVSRRHAEVCWNGETRQVTLRDLGSRNGTFVGGQPVSEVTVAVGSMFRCGRVSLRVLDEKDMALKGASAAPPLSVKTSAAGKKHEGSSQPVSRLPARIPAEVRDYKAGIAETLRKRLDRSREEGDDSQDRLRSRVERIVSDLIREFPPQSSLPREDVHKSLMDDLLGYGPLEPYLEDNSITEIMVNREDLICIERNGRIEYAGDEFQDRTQLMNVIERIVNQVNRKVNESSPLVDARLPDGSRVNVIIPPLALDGPCLTIRKFRKEGFTIDNLVEYGSLSSDIAEFMRICVENRLNILISGGTGSGKTTLLNVMSSFIPQTERIVTIEDSAELRLPQYHVVRLETRPENMEGRGRVAIRDLVINALRMRPDRIVVGECRGGEALDMVQAMNTGHDGSLTTVHANSPRDAIRRLEVMCLMAGVDLPLRAIREQLASAIQIVMQIARFNDGSRKVIQVSEVTGMQQDIISMQDIFKFHDKGLDEQGCRQGVHSSTGIVPVWADEFRSRNIPIDLDMFKQPAKMTEARA